MTIQNTMQHNVCDTCGASDGRAGTLVGVDGRDECFNCYDTRKNGAFTIHANLNRTEAELAKTAAILTTPAKNEQG